MFSPCVASFSSCICAVITLEPRRASPLKSWIFFKKKKKKEFLRAGYVSVQITDLRINREGTTDVLAGDTVRAIKHPRDGEDVLKGLTWVVETGLDFVGGGDGGKAGWVAGVRRAWDEVKGRLEREAQGALLPDARAVVFRVAEVLLAVLYMVDAAVRPGPEIEEMCRRYLVEKGFAQDAEGVGKKDVAMDQAIVYGAGKVPGQGTAGVKL